MSDNIRHPSLARKAGRGFLRAMRGLFGGRTLDRAAESWEALRAEYSAGRKEADDTDPPPRPIPHRELGTSPETGPKAGPGGPTSAGPPAPPRVS